MSRLILVTGMHGSGKTTYCNKLGKLGHPVIHIDNVYDYKTKDMDYNKIRSWVNNNNQCDTLVMDAYIYAIDPGFSKLKESIFPIVDVDVKIIYTEINELLECQVSTPSRLARTKKLGLSKEEHIQKIKMDQKRVMGIVTGYLDKGIVSSVEYIFRGGDNYTATYNKKHFLNMYRGMSIEELLKLMAPYEKNEKYQTIEIDDKIVRPGGQKCWKSWENICKFNIDWKYKFVCDIGCYFGYFSTKVLRSGASSVMGIDERKQLLFVYKEVLFANGFTNCETLQLKLGNGNVVPNNGYDIALAMNMLHHVQKNTTESDYIKVLDSIFKSTKEALFEVNNNQIKKIKEVALKNNFILKNSVKSHRAGATRTILYFVS